MFGVSEDGEITLLWTELCSRCPHSCIEALTPTVTALGKGTLRRYCCLITQSCLTLCDPVDCVACQAPLSMGFSTQEYWSGLPDLQGIFLTQG